MTIQDALQNIRVVVSEARMKFDEHVALQQSINLVEQRCKLADELEKEKKACKDLAKE